MSRNAQAAAPLYKLRVNRALLIILVTVFLNVMGFGIILPVLPFYATAFGASGTEVGLLFTTFAALQFLASPVFGALSDRFGRRPIILFGIVGQIVGYLLLGFAPSLSMLFLARSVTGVMAGNIGATQAYVADTTPPKERTRAFGLVGAAFGAGLLFGPALGGILSLLHSRAPAFGAGALLFLNLLFAYMVLPESLPPDRRTHKPIVGQLNPFSVLVPIVRRPALRGPLVVTFLLNVALTGLQANFAVFAGERFGLGPAAVAGLLAASGLANIVVQAVLVPSLSARLSDATLVLAGTAVNSIGYLATGFAPVPTVFWGSVPLTTGGYSLARGPLTSLITKLVAPTEQGMVNGGVQATISLAGVVGPAWAGVVYESVGKPAPYWTAALMAGLAIVALIMRGARKEESMGQGAFAPAIASSASPSVPAEEVKTSVALTVQESAPVRHPQKSGRLLLTLFAVLVILLVSIAGASFWFYTAVQHHPVSTLPSPASQSRQPSPPPPTPRVTSTPVPVSSPYPKIAVQYTGTLHDIPTTTTTNIALTHIQQQQGNISGYFSGLPANPLFNGIPQNGPFTGTIDTAKQIHFIVMSDIGQATFSFDGVMQSDGTIGGTYCSLEAAAGKCSDYGVWSLSPAT